MANIDHERKRITAVLLVYGPPGAGKTTALYALARHLPPGTHGKVAPLQQGDERLLRLDYRPNDHDMVYGYQLSFRLVTCPGPINMDLVRPVLAAADAVMFVADSASDSLDANVSAMEDLERMSRSCGRRLDDLPIVFMYNKRDLRDALEIRLLESRLNRFGSNYLAASALRGQGVLEALQRLTATVAVQLRPELSSTPGVTGGTSSTVARGQTYQDARAANESSQDLDDITAVSVDSRPGPPDEAWEGSDDHTEVNAHRGAWEIDEAPPAAHHPSTPPSYGGGHPGGGFEREPSPQSYGGGGGQYGGGRPGFHSGGASYRSEPHRRAPVNPAYGDQSWRTPDAFADMDPGAHTRSYADAPPGGSMSVAPPAPGATDRRQGPISGRSLHRPASTPRGPVYRSPQRGYPPAGGRAGFEPQDGRRLDSARLSGSMRDEPRPGSLRGVPGSGSLRGVPGMGSMHGSPDGNARQAQAGTQTGSGTFTKTMAINALGRESEAWEKGIEQSGHPVKLQAPDLSGYIVSRIGTPKAASRRTVRIPVRATHMDTLVPQDFIIDVEFRGGVGSSRTRAVSARRTPVKQERSIPVSWFVATVGFLMVAVLVLWFVIYLKG